MGISGNRKMGMMEWGDGVHTVYDGNSSANGKTWVFYSFPSPSPSQCDRTLRPIHIDRRRFFDWCLWSFFWLSFDLFRFPSHFRLLWKDPWGSFTASQSGSGIGNSIWCLSFILWSISLSTPLGVKRPLELNRHIPVQTWSFTHQCIDHRTAHRFTWTNTIISVKVYSHLKVVELVP